MNCVLKSLSTGFQLKPPSVVLYTVSVFEATTTFSFVGDTESKVLSSLQCGPPLPANLSSMFKPVNFHEAPLSTDFIIPTVVAAYTTLLLERAI